MNFEEFIKNKNDGIEIKGTPSAMERFFINQSTQNAQDIGNKTTHFIQAVQSRYFDKDGNYIDIYREDDNEWKQRALQYANELSGVIDSVASYYKQNFSNDEGFSDKQMRLYEAKNNVDNLAKWVQSLESYENEVDYNTKKRQYTTAEKYKKTYGKVDIKDLFGKIKELEDYKEKIDESYETNNLASGTMYRGLVEPFDFKKFVSDISANKSLQQNDRLGNTTPKEIELSLNDIAFLKGQGHLIEVKKGNNTYYQVNVDLGDNQPIVIKSAPVADKIVKAENQAIVPKNEVINSNLNKSQETELTFPDYKYINPFEYNRDNIDDAILEAKEYLHDVSFVQATFNMDEWYSTFNQKEDWNELSVVPEKPDSEDADKLTKYNYEEKQIYYYLKNSQGQEAANKWLTVMQSTAEKRYDEKKETEYNNFAQEYGKKFPLLLDAASIGFNVFAALEYVPQTIDYFSTGFLKTNQAAKVATTFRKYRTDSIDWMVGDWDAHDFLYNVGMSTADSAIASLLPGNVGGVVLGLSAAASATNDALERGMSSEQAFWHGAYAGAFEVIFESVSIGNIKSLATKNIVGKKGAIKEVLKSMLVNALEENLTECANLIYDTMANGDFSQASMLIQKYLDEGKSPEEAKRLASKDLAYQVAEATASGLISGGVMGSVGAVTNYKKGSDLGKQVRAEYTKDGLNSLYEYAKNNYSFNKDISAIVGKYTAENIDNHSLGVLYSSVVTEVASRLDACQTISELNNKCLEILNESNDAIAMRNVLLKLREEAAYKIAKKNKNKAELNEITPEKDVAFYGKKYHGQYSTEQANALKRINNQVLKKAYKYFYTGQSFDTAATCYNEVDGKMVGTNGTVSSSAVNRYIPKDVIGMNNGTYDYLKKVGLVNYDGTVNGYALMDEIARRNGNVTKPVDGGGMNVYNNIRGESYANYNGQTMGGIPKTKEGQFEVDSRGKSQTREERGGIEENDIRGAQGDTHKGGPGKRVYVKAGNRSISYTPKKEDNSVGGNAVRRLKGIGIKAIFCDGDIVAENGSHSYYSEAITLPDGTVYVSSNATLSDVEIAAHEVVHSYEVKKSEVYKKYEVIILDELAWNKTDYRHMATYINDKHYNGKYDIYSSVFEKLFLHEISAYINQYVITNEQKANELFSGLFNNWDAVVEASRQFNKDIGADFSKSASFMPENESVLPEVSAQSPEADPVADSVFEAKGLQRLTEDQKFIKRVGKAFGREVLFKNLDEWRTDENGRKYLFSPNGKYDKTTGKIYINSSKNAQGNALAFIFKHELTHFAETAGDAFTNFMNGVMDSQAFKDWVKSKGYTDGDGISATMAMNKKYISNWKFEGKDAEHKANLEMVADFVADNLFVKDLTKLEQAINELKPKEIKTFKDLVLSILQKIKSIFQKRGFNNIDQIEREFVRVCDKAMKAAEQKTADKTKNSTDEGGEQYSLFVASADVLDLVQKVKTGDFKANEKVYFENVSDELASKIESLTGINVKGFKVAIEARQIEHILKDHGENGKSDHSMSSDEDIAKMQYVLKNPDDLSLSGKTQAYSYMKNGYNKTADTVLYEKAIGNKSYYVVQAIPDTKAKTLYVVSAFIGEKGYKKETSQLINAKSPDATAKSGSVVVSDNSIDQNDQSVNSYSMQQSEDYSEDDSEKFSFAGERATTADNSRLLRAKQMLENGVNEEEIRQETGWFKGYDGKWRFEIDDSEMQVDPNGKIIKSEVVEDSMSVMKNANRQQAATSVKNIVNSVGHLDDYIRHKKLFEAYPELKRVEFNYSLFFDGTTGAYDPVTKSITVDLRLRKDVGELKKVLIHEIQHAIQDIEDFAVGANYGYWENVIKTANMQHQEYQQEADKCIRQLSDKMGDDFVREVYDIAEELSRSAYAETEAKVNALEDKARRKGCKRLYNKAVYALLRLDCVNRVISKLGGRSAEELYYATAGEIEARDSANRWWRSDEARKKMRPDIDRTDVVFSDDNVSYSVSNGVDTYTEEQYNNFGWVRYNNILSASEYNTLLSRYADYKHNKDKYPTTRFGEAVIHSSEWPDVLMYVKGPIRSPQITKVIRIKHNESWATPFIKEEILKNEHQRNYQPFKTVEDYFGYGVLSIAKARDNASFREYRAETKRSSGQTINTFGGIKQNGAGSTKQNTSNDRADLKESAFSMPESDDVQYSMSNSVDKFWYPNMSRQDIEFVKRRAKYELNTTDNYIDNITKWLYNEKNGNIFFALYSTEDANAPTVLYACKDNRAKFEHEIIIQYFEEEVNENGRLHERAKIVNKVLEDYGSDDVRRSLHRRNALGRGSNGGNATVYSRNSRNRPSEALLNCLRNISEISDRNRADLKESASFMPENEQYSVGLTDTEQFDTKTFANQLIYKYGESSLSQKKIADLLTDIEYDFLNSWFSDAFKKATAIAESFNLEQFDDTDAETLADRIMATISEANKKAYDAVRKQADIDKKSTTEEENKRLISSLDSAKERVRTLEVQSKETETVSEKRKGRENPISIARLKPQAANTTPFVEKQTGNAPGDKRSNFYENMQGSSIFDERFKEDMKNDDYIKTYNSTTNKETLRKAVKALETGGQQYVTEWFQKPTDEASLLDITVGLLLIDRYQRVGDTEGAIATAQRVREMGTASGQQVQIFSIIGRFDPNTMAAYAQKELSTAYELLVKGKTNKWVEANKKKFELTPDEIESIRRRTLQAAMLPECRQKAILLAEICAMLQNKIPPESGQSIRAWQRISMLLNVKTNVRNIVGNLGMVPVYFSSDYFGSLLDKAVSKKTGVRTTGISDPLANVFTKSGREHISKGVKGFGKGLYESFDDFKRGIHTKQEELNRYAVEGFDAYRAKGDIKHTVKKREGVAQGGKSFNENTQYKVINAIAKKLNALDNITSFCLEVGDRPFFEMWFMNSLNNQLRLNKTTEPTPDMIDIATQDALQRTWQDESKMAKMVANLKKNANAFHLPGTTYGLGDFIFKFTKTPANIAKAIVDFSPAGLVSAAFKANNIKNAIETAQFTPQMQRDFVKTASNAITGTFIYALVIVGASLGFVKLSGAGDDDKDVSNFEKYIAGIPPYSIELFGTNVTYDWFQPFGSTLAISAAYMENRSDPETSWDKDILDAFVSAGTVFTEQSFLKSLNEFFKAVEADGNIFMGLLDMAISDPSVNIPTLFSQVGSFLDGDRRSTYDATSDFKTMINGLMSKLPGVRKLLPEQVDVLGKDVENNQYLDPWRAFASPYNEYPESAGEVANKIYELYKSTGDKTVMPRVAPNYITIKGRKYSFDTEEKANYQRETGKASAEMLEILFNSDFADGLTEKQLVDVVNKIYDYSTKLAKITVVSSDYDYELLSAMVGKKNNGEPILTKEKYNTLTDDAKLYIIQDYMLSKAELKFKTREDAVKYFVKQVLN